MRELKPEPLRKELQAAIHNMDRALKHGWSKRRDTQAVRNSMDLAQTFLNHNPAASDERVKEWCSENWQHVGRFIPPAHYRRLERLLMEQLKPKKEAKVIQMQPTDTPAA